MIKETEQIVKRGDIVYVDLPKVDGSIQFGKRPAVVISNNMNNTYSDVLWVVSLTSRQTKKPLPTHKVIEPDKNNGLRSKSIALCEQPLLVTKGRIISQIGKMADNYMGDIMDGIRVQCAM